MPVTLNKFHRLSLSFISRFQKLTQIQGGSIFCSMGEFLTLRQFREKHNIPLTVDDFIKGHEPCENPDLYFPYPIIPHHLMDPDKAIEAEKLFEQCSQIVGDAFGSYASKKDTPKFQELSKQFKELTGVDPWEIMQEARGRLVEMFID